MKWHYATSSEVSSVLAGFCAVGRFSYNQKLRSLQPSWYTIMGSFLFHSFCNRHDKSSPNKWISVRNAAAAPQLRDLTSNQPRSGLPMTIRTASRIPTASPTLGGECGRTISIKHEFSLEHLQMLTAKGNAMRLMRSLVVTFGDLWM